MTKLQTSSILCCLLIPSYIRGVEPAPDLFLGTWVLEPKASHYPGNSCPKQMTIEMTRETRGVHYHSHTQPSTGDAFDVDYIANYNGKPVMVTGSKGILLPVSLERKGITIIATYRSAFQVMATSQRVLSADNNTMTITTVSYVPMGTAVTNVGVYRRAPSSSSPLQALPKQLPAF
ncbi:MAG: hypothetical protein JWM43_474 [Acidobacteriaceae bacterium]|nr:hypothetical protein [Acidobacteriaceae bacterium]